MKCTINKQGGTDVDIKGRIGKARTAYTKLQKIMESKQKFKEKTK